MSLHPSQQNRRLQETIDVNSPLSDLTLHLDHQTENDRQEHEENSKQSRRKNTLNDTKGGSGQFTDPSQPAGVGTKGINVGDDTDKRNRDGPDNDQANSEAPRDDSSGMTFPRTHRDVGPFNIFRDKFDTATDVHVGLVSFTRQLSKGVSLELRRESDERSVALRKIFNTFP